MERKKRRRSVKKASKGKRKKRITRYVSYSVLKFPFSTNNDDDDDDVGADMAPEGSKREDADEGEGEGEREGGDSRELENTNCTGTSPTNNLFLKFN